MSGGVDAVDTGAVSFGGVSNERTQEERKAMNEEFDRRIRELQDSCAHEETTNWLQSEYGRCKLCRRCMKTVEHSSKLTRRGSDDARRRD